MGNGAKCRRRKLKEGNLEQCFSNVGMLTTGGTWMLTWYAKKFRIF
jgi:hypothetical protein